MKLVEGCSLQPWNSIRGLLSPNGVVDTGADALGGRVYLAENDVAEAAGLFGWVSPQQVAEWTEKLRELSAELGRAIEENERIAAMLEQNVPQVVSLEDVRGLVADAVAAAQKPKPGPKPKVAA